MYVNNYFHKIATELCEDHFEIEGLSREVYANAAYVKMFKEDFANIKLTRPTAVLYAGGANTHQSEARNIGKLKFEKYATINPTETSMVVKEVTAYMVHKFIGQLQDNHWIKHVNINSNSCASSMHSIYEAERLLLSGEVEEVIVIAEERTSFNTVRIFSEHRINVRPGDAFACMTLSLNDKSGSDMQITDTKWQYSYNRNPFFSASEGYDSVNTEGCDWVKPHGTGTEQNDGAEAHLLLGKNVIKYKHKIGHAQGASALVEICEVLRAKEVNGKILCLASGLGGFYGSCVVHK